MPVDGDKWERYIISVAASLDKPVAAEIVTKDEKVEDYWPVLEHGSRKGQRPWPLAKKKTRLRGGRVFSSQAVGGFIDKNARHIVEYLTESYTRRIRQLKRPLNRAELVAAANEAGARALKLLRVAIPVDTGKAKNSLDMRKAR